MDNFAYVGASDGLCRPWHRKIQTSMDSVTAEKISGLSSRMSFLIKAKTMEKLLAAYRLLFSEHLIRRIRSSWPGTPEVLVANFNGVDCFTLADYVEALARSDNQKSFLHNLARTRYAAGKVAYLSRRHFFSDWSPQHRVMHRDVTPDISPDYVVVDKQLNHKPDGGEYIPGLGIHPRKNKLYSRKSHQPAGHEPPKKWDYIGVYSPLDGLDVLHVGIVVRHDEQVWFGTPPHWPQTEKWWTHRLWSTCIPDRASLCCGLNDKVTTESPADNSRPT
ncbi:putative inner membrane protein [Salmonella enterica subsp. enterica]|uniref:Putative inner membrane protein n=1 Tax=Salmonella enterica I TaxID=59201 RepID=A0A379WMH6_SALET|nr:putative inner membrane protein [Salmonella enterica subsp. enterica]